MADAFDCSIHGRETQVFCWRAYEKWPETKAVDDMFGGDIMSGDLSFYEGQRKRRELCERIWREAQVDAAKENSPSLKMSLESFMKHCEKRAEAAEAQRDRLTAA